MKRYLRLILFGMLLSLNTLACSNEDIGETSQELISTYRIGNSSTVIDTTAAAITAVYQSISALPNPSFSPGTGTSFVQTFSIGNGGYHISGSNVGNLNKLTFRIYEVTGTYGNEYYAATADIWKADATGHTFLTTNVLLATAWPRHRFELYWQDGMLSFYVYDPSWNFEMVANYNLTFPSGPPITTVYSPELDFTINSTPSIGCHNDILSYDENVHDTGHYPIEISYGINADNEVPAYLGSPLTNSMCSILTNQYHNVGYDVVQWTNQGF